MSYREIINRVMHLLRCGEITAATPNEEVWGKVLQTEEPVTLDFIAEAVCMQTGVTMEELLSQNRVSQWVEARWMVAWLARQYTTRTSASIARFLHRRAHGTVLHGIEKGNDYMNEPRLNPGWTRKVKKIINEIELRYE